MNSVSRTLDVGKETFVFWVIGEETLERTTNHGVLAHQDDSLTTEGASDLVHLLGGDIVDADLE